MSRSRSGSKRTFCNHNFGSRRKKKAERLFFSSPFSFSKLIQKKHGLVLQGGLAAFGPAPAGRARCGVGVGQQLRGVVIVFFFGRHRRRPDRRRRRFRFSLLFFGRPHDRAPAWARPPDPGVVVLCPGPGHAADDAAQRGQDRLGGHGGKRIEFFCLFFFFCLATAISFFFRVAFSPSFSPLSAASSQLRLRRG